MVRWLMAVLLAAVVVVPAGGSPKPKDRENTGKTVSAVQPKPLSENVRRGLAWLARMQQKGGGWSQGEESQAMGHGMDNLRDVPNVADTCIAALAMMRAGSTPRSGEYAKNVSKAVAYVCSEIEESDAKSLCITKTRGTRVQMKLGPFIDTFLASLLLAEAKGQMPDVRSEKRAGAAFHKVMDKIEKNQRPDGTWDQSGWAPILSQSLASKAINRAAQKGAKVNEQVRLKAQDYSRRQFDAKSGGFGMAGSPGVALYSYGGNLGAMQQSENTNFMKEREARDKLRTARTNAERKQAATTLKSIEANRRDLNAAMTATVRKLDDAQFMSGFGSNGGEEFLSYMNIGESLALKSGEEWKKWDKSMTANLNRIQNKDGTWTGHHCITGRTFCTAAALLVLTVDRAPKPWSDKFRRR
jgi:hypothetical protein